MTSTAERWLLRAILSYSAFMLYGSWVPLGWRPQPLGEAWAAFLALPGPVWPPESVVDTAVNALLPMPLVFGLALRAALARPRVMVSVVRVATAMALLGLLPLVAEFGQMFVEGRDPSWSDVTAQWTGSLLGLLLFVPFGASARRWWDRLVATHAVRDRALAWLSLYLLGLLAYELMPLDLSISPVELYRKWRDGHVILLPFVGLPGGAWGTAFKLLGGVLAWMPVGLMWRWSRPQAPLAALVLRGAGLALCVEVAQLFVLSRVTSVTDVLLGGAGTAAGAGLSTALAHMSALTQDRRNRLGSALAVAWLLAAITATWAPFRFDASQGSAEAWMQAFSRIPFTTYFVRSELGALGEIVHKMVLYVPAGLLLAWRWPSRAVVGHLVLGLVAFLLESGQVWLPDKTADLTDALLGVAGALLGWRMAHAVLHASAPSVGSTMGAAAGAPSGSPPMRARPSPPAAGPRSWVGTAVQLLALAASAWLLARSPVVPYNIAKLMPGGLAGGLSAVGMAVTLWWVIAAPMRLLGPGRSAALVLLPLPLLAHGLVAFALLRLTIPVQMLHKVVGSPVLGWPGPWEDLLRFLALHMAVMVPVVGGMVLVRVVWQPARVADLISWMFVALLVAWPLHAAVVDAAATDNLVELMRGGGSLLTSAALATAVWMASTAGSSIALLLAQRRCRLAMCLLAVVAVAAIPVLLHWGLEPMLVKYGHAFSALQFILSSDREHYAAPAELQARLGIALLAVVLLVAFLQRPAWKSLAAA